jgi:flagellar biosynthesis/type III secretory pathway ATPase
VLDEAVAIYPRLEAFLVQDMHQRDEYRHSRESLEALFH